MDKTAALHRCELCGETVGEEDLGGFVEEQGPFCIWCMNEAIELSHQEKKCAYCYKTITLKEASGWLADEELGGPLCYSCMMELALMTKPERKEAIDELRKEKKGLAQDNMRHTWSSNSRA